MSEFRMRNTGREQPARELLCRAFPELADSFGRHSAVSLALRVGERSLDSSGRLAPGSLLEGEFADGSYAEALGTGKLAPIPEEIAAQGDGWSVLRVPVGWASPFLSVDHPLVQECLHEVIASKSKKLRFALVPELDTCGLHLLAHSEEDQVRLQASFAKGEIELRARALLPAPPWPEGTLSRKVGEFESRCAFGILHVSDGIAEVELIARGYALIDLRRELSRVGLPILGDALFGGRMVSGGLRLCVNQIAVESGSRPCVARIDEGEVDPFAAFGEPVFSETSEERILEISSGSVRALNRGHPWVIRDAYTGDAGRFTPGTRVTLVEERSGRLQGSALIEGEGQLAARRWSSSLGTKGRGDSVEARVAEAFKRRQALFETEGTAQETNAFRLVHGEADGLPGFFADRLAQVLRVQLMGRACEQFADRAIAALRHGIDKRLGFVPAVVKVIHIRESPAGELRCVFLAQDEALRGDFDERGRLLVMERGLQYAVQLGLEEPFRPRPGVGLFLDQRENRERLSLCASRGRGNWLNLFAHTGAFSVCLLAAGADKVTSVDLSASYLQWLEDNLTLNHLDGESHRAIRGDGRRVLDQLLEKSELFDGIVLDPPTAAAAGRKFWAVHSGGEALFERALLALRPGGTLLVCRNDRGAANKLRSWVERTAKSCGVCLDAVEPAPPSCDFPRLQGFPEGDSFGGFLLTRAS